MICNTITPQSGTKKLIYMKYRRKGIISVKKAKTILTKIKYGVNMPDMYLFRIHQFTVFFRNQ
jgi:hypothetical protein